MQDRFKFRFWNKSRKIMETFNGFSDAIGDILTNEIKAEPYIIMQCTGLKDKNGRLIYEGDILYENMINTVFPKGKYWIVEWNNNTAQFFIELINKTGNSLTDTWHLARHSYDYEVIGNIYQNPEPFYPEFTAEKQIELIKWLAKKYGEIHILNNMARGFAIGIMGISFNLKHFEEIIPMVLNTFWQDLTDAERKQIKEILE